MSLARRLWKCRRDRPFLVFLSVLTVAVLIVWPVVDFYLREADLVTPFAFADFGAYGTAVDRWTAGEQIYVQDDSGGYHGSFLYPPVTLLLFYPFRTFGWELGPVLFSGVSFVLLWVGLEAVAATLGYRVRLHERLVLLVALFGFHPAARDFKWAQISTLLAALLCFAFVAQECGASTPDGDEGSASPVSRSHALYRYGSGALTTVASSFKLFFAPSGAHLLRDRRRFVGAMLTAVGIVGLSLAVFGVEAHLTYLDVLAWGKDWGQSYPPQYWDRAAAYRPLYVFGGLGTPIRAIGVLAIVALALLARTARTTTVRHGTFALGVAAVPLLAPRADSHDLVVLLLPALILLATELDRPDGYPSIPVVAVLALHLHRYVLEVTIHPPDWLPAASLVAENAAWLQPGMWATFLLVGLAAYRVATAVEPGVSIPTRQ